MICKKCLCYDYCSRADEGSLPNDGCSDWVEADPLARVHLYTPISEMQRSIKRIELVGRTCYKGDVDKKGNLKKINLETARNFITKRLESNPPHESILEHGYMTVKFSGVSRGFSHEVIRHRL